MTIIEPTRNYAIAHGYSLTAIVETVDKPSSTIGDWYKETGYRLMTELSPYMNLPFMEGMRNRLEEELEK